MDSPARLPPPSEATPRLPPGAMDCRFGLLEANCAGCADSHRNWRAEAFRERASARIGAPGVSCGVQICPPLPPAELVGRFGTDAPDKFSWRAPMGTWGGCQVSGLLPTVIVAGLQARGAGCTGASGRWAPESAEHGCLRCEEPRRHSTGQVSQIFTLCPLLRWFAVSMGWLRQVHGRLRRPHAPAAPSVEHLAALPPPEISLTKRVAREAVDCRLGFRIWSWNRDMMSPA